MNQDQTVEPTADTLTRQQQAVHDLPHQEASIAGAAKRAIREFWPEVPRAYIQGPDNRRRPVASLFSRRYPPRLHHYTAPGGPLRPWRVQGQRWLNIIPPLLSGAQENDAGQEHEPMRINHRNRPHPYRTRLGNVHERTPTRRPSHQAAR